MFKRIFNFLALFLLVIIIAGCVVPFRGGPSNVELDQADYGAPPADYQKKIEIWFNDYLKDPFSAKIEILNEPEKSWWGQTGALLQKREINFGWVVKTKVNAKNSFGAYIGWKAYNFFFRDGDIKYTQYEK